MKSRFYLTNRLFSLTFYVTSMVGNTVEHCGDNINKNWW